MPRGIFDDGPQNETHDQRDQIEFEFPQDVPETSEEKEHSHVKEIVVHAVCANDAEEDDHGVENRGGDS